METPLVGVMPLLPNEFPRPLDHRGFLSVIELIQVIHIFSEL